MCHKHACDVNKWQVHLATVHGADIITFFAISRIVKLLWNYSCPASHCNVREMTMAKLGDKWEDVTVIVGSRKDLRAFRQWEQLPSTHSCVGGGIHLLLRLERKDRKENREHGQNMFKPQRSHRTPSRTVKWSRVHARWHELGAGDSHHRRVCQFESIVCGNVKRGKEGAHYFPARSDIVLGCSTIRAIFGRPRRWQCGQHIPAGPQCVITHKPHSPRNETFGQKRAASFPGRGLSGFLSSNTPHLWRQKDRKRGRDGRGGDTTWMRNMMWSFWAPDSQWVVSLHFACAGATLVLSVGRSVVLSPPASRSLPHPRAPVTLHNADKGDALGGRVDGCARASSRTGACCVPPSSIS